MANFLSGGILGMQRVCVDQTGGLMDDLNAEYSVPNILTSLSYAVVLILLWYFIKINFLIQAEGLTPGPSGPYSGDLVELPSGSLDDLEASPEMVKENIWSGSDLTWDEAVRYTGSSTNTAAGLVAQARAEMYHGGAPSDSEPLVDIAARDGYAGGRGLSHREGLDNPDGDIDGDYGMYDIIGTRTNAPSQPLDPSILSGMYGDVPILLYNDADTKKADQWGLGTDKLYRFNSYTA